MRLHRTISYRHVLRARILGLNLIFDVVHKLSYAEIRTRDRRVRSAHPFSLLRRHPSTDTILDRYGVAKTRKSMSVKTWFLVTLEFQPVCSYLPQLILKRLRFNFQIQETFQWWRHRWQNTSLKMQEEVFPFDLNSHGLIWTEKF